ncbi:MAG TPA: tyrosine-type recombinase/integrase [Thermoanaerobacterales bacterium]|nr:tyrosine-type recombinase/integrase [Thermoanaerobacterales bacterium]
MSKKPTGLFWKYAREYVYVYLPKLRNLSPHTIEAYKFSLSYFVLYLEGHLKIKRQDIAFEHFSRQNIKSYVIWMNEQRNLAPGTCNLRLSALKSFTEYCAREDITLMAIHNEVKSVPAMRQPKNPILFLTDDAVKALLRAPQTESDKGKRDRIILIVLYDTAARAQELVSITVKDLHITGVQTPFVTLTGKGKKIRNVPLMKKTVDHLKVYLKKFHPELQRDRPLFYSNRDGRPHALSTDTINHILKKYAAKARHECNQMPEHVHCHLLRKTRAMALYRQGIPISYIMQLLGHESLTTTTNFYAFATLDMIHKAMIEIEPTSHKNEVPIWKEKEILDVIFSLR